MLAPAEIQKLKTQLALSGWTDVQYPAMKNHRDGLVGIVLKCGAERPEPYRTIPDDIIRGEIRGVEWAMNVWQQEIAVSDHNRMRDELDRNGQESETSSPANRG